jgi:protein ImuA
MDSIPTSSTQSVDRLALRARLEQLCRTNGSAMPTPQPTGFPELDARLGGGWPIGALTECLLDTRGIGELSLWMPALRKIALDKRHIAFITPPFLPYAPALVQQGIPLKQVFLVECSNAEESLWATEQTLRCAAFGAVLAWPRNERTLTDKQLRRLQLAAEAGRNLGVLYRPLAAAQSASPAALRIKLQAALRIKLQMDASLVINSAINPASNCIQVVIHKCRSGRSGVTVQCAIDQPLQAA